MCRAWPIILFFLVPIILLDYSKKCSLLFSCILPIILIVLRIKKLSKLVYWLTMAIGLLTKNEAAV